MENEHGKKSAELMNKVAGLLNITDKNLGFSVVLGMLIRECGLSVSEAWDAVFGPGTYVEMKGDLWESLRK